MIAKEKGLEPLAVKIFNQTEMDGVCLFLFSTRQSFKVKLKPWDTKKLH